MKSYIYILLLLVLVACTKKEDALTPSGSLAYALPQGNHGYDTTIMNIYQQYGTYILYKFTEKDAYWTPTGWRNSYYDSTNNYWRDGFLMQPADEQYVGRQLQLVERLWFRYYSEKFLKEFLPVKILLCSEIDSSYLEYDWSTTPYSLNRALKPVNAWYNYDNICISFGNSTALTPQDSGTFTWKTSEAFMNAIFTQKPISPTDEFIRTTSYATSFTSQEEAYTNGSITDYYNASAQGDWEKYIMAMVTCSEEMLNQPEEPGWSSSNVGILNSLKDTSGRIRKRYDMVRNYFITNYNVDLQVIGNAAIPQ